MTSISGFNLSLLLDTMKPVLAERLLSASVLRHEPTPGAHSLLFNVVKVFGKERKIGIVLSAQLVAPGTPIEDYAELVRHLATELAYRFEYLDMQERVIAFLIGATPEDIAVIKLLGEKHGRVELPDAEHISPSGISSFLNHVEEHAGVYRQLQPYLPYARLQRANLIDVEPFGLFPPFAQFTNLGYHAHRLIHNEVAIRVIAYFGDDFYTAFKKTCPGMNFATTVREIEANASPTYYVYTPDSKAVRVELKCWRSWDKEDDRRVGFVPELNTLLVVKRMSEGKTE